MKVLFFIHSLGLGGAERVTVTLANHWARRGWQVGILTLAGVEQDQYSLDPAVTRIALGRAAPSTTVRAAITENWLRIRAVRRVLTGERPDVAVAMMSTANVVLALASVGAGRIVCIGSERIHPPRLPLSRAWAWLRGFSYRWLDAIVVLSTDSLAWARAHSSARRVVVIPNPVTWPLPSAEPIRSPESVGAPTRKRLLAVGRLEAQKGFQLLIEVFTALVPHSPTGSW